MADIQTQIEIERLLFETGAIRVAPENEPFWYTSGTIGPYYSNTQNLIGSEAEANRLLNLIDSELSGDRLMLPAAIARRVFDAYEKNESYRAVAGYIKKCIIDNIDIDSIDFISGGERRDWFFSYIAAGMFNKPHITIFKDLSMVINEPYPGAVVYGSCDISGRVPGAGFFATAAPVKSDVYAGKRLLHVSDIITEASSYANAWVPAAAKSGMTICASLTILDRLQGGGATLAALGIKHISIAKLDADFFDRALNHGHIDEKQHALLREYIADPVATMRAFLKRRPEFLQDALASGGKEAERARMCIESDIY